MTTLLSDDKGRDEHGEIKSDMFCRPQRLGPVCFENKEVTARSDVFARVQTPGDNGLPRPINMSLVPRELITRKHPEVVISVFYSVHTWKPRCRLIKHF